MGCLRRAVRFVFVPAVAIQSLANADALSKQYPALAPLLANSAASGLVTSVVPSLLLLFLTWLWPLFLRLLTVWQGAQTWSQVDRGMMAKSFLFNVLVAFVSTVLSGAIWNGLRDIVHEPGHLPRLLAVKVPGTSSFFMKYVIIQGVGASAGCSPAGCRRCSIHYDKGPATPSGPHSISPSAASSLTSCCSSRSRLCSPPSRR